MNKKLKKKFLLPLTFIGTVVSSLVLSACGSFNFDSIKSIKINLPFVENSAQAESFKIVVNKYNSWFDSKKDQLTKEGYLPLVTAFTNNYGQNTAVLTTQLKAKDFASLPNLSFGYGSNVYDIAKNNLTLDFQNIKSLKSFYNKDFLLPNENIAQVDPKGLYLLPMGISTDLLYINKIVMNYLLSEAVKQSGFSIKSEDKEWFKNNFGIEKTDSTASGTSTTVTKAEIKYTPGTEKTNSAKTYFGSIKSDYFNNQNKLEVSKATFESYDKFFEFSQKLAEAFEGSSSKQKNMVGLTPSNLYEILSFMKTGSDFSKFLWNRPENKQTYDYSFLSKIDTPKSKVLEEVYNLVYNLSQKGGIWLSPKVGSYASTSFVKNKLLFLIGSNSGYKFNIFSDDKKATASDNEKNKKESVGKDDLMVINSPLKLNNFDTNGAYTVQGGALFGIKFDDRIDKATKLFVDWMTKIDSNKENEFEYKKVEKNGDKNEVIKKVNASDFYALQSGYVPGSLNFVQSEDNMKYMQTPAAAVAFELFNKMSKKDSTESTFKSGMKIFLAAKAFIEPVGELSGTFRNYSDGSSIGKNSVISYKDFFDGLTKNPSVQEWLIQNSKK